MLEWVCPKCDRDVDPAFTACPFCGNAEATPVEPRLTGAAKWKAIGESVFRFSLGAMAVLTVVYFIAWFAAYSLGREDWVEALTRWLPGH